MMNIESFFFKQDTLRKRGGKKKKKCLDIANVDNLLTGYPVVFFSTRFFVFFDLINILKENIRLTIRATRHLFYTKS